MAEDSSEVKEQFGQGFGGKVLVLRLTKKEVKNEQGEEEQLKSIGKGIEQDTGIDKRNDANSVSDRPSSVPTEVSMTTIQPSSVNAIIQPLHDRPQQLPAKVEEGQAAVNGGSSMADELQQLKDALKSKDLLNSLLLAKLEEMRKEKIEEQRKSALMAEELKLAKEKPNNTDKETETETTTLQPLRAIIAAQRLGIDPQLLDEPQRNEWKTKFEQLNIKYLKVKQIAANLHKKLEDKEKDAAIDGHEEQFLAQFGEEEEPVIESNGAFSSPQQDKLQLTEQMRQQLLANQMDFDLSPPVVDEEDGKDGRMLEKANANIDGGRRRRLSEENSGGNSLPTMMQKKKKEEGAANIVAIVSAVPAGVFKCPQCPSNQLAFSSAEQLGKHQRHWHGDRQHYRRRCPECGLACVSNGHLQTHMRTHTGEKPFKCRQCGRGFSQKSKLKEHERVHTGERPYRCPVCQKQFTTHGDLTRHTRVHTGETPYCCQYCAKKFKRASHCRRHEMTCPIRAGQAATTE